MTSVSSSTNPVATIVSILDNTTDSDWVNTGEKPGRIGRWAETTMKQKETYIQSDALYCYSPEDAGLLIQGVSGTSAGVVDRYPQTEVVAVDCWVYNNEDRLDLVSSDVSNILVGYAHDPAQANTVWTQIFPRSIGDNSHQRNPHSGDHARTIVTVDLMRLRDNTA